MSEDAYAAELEAGNEAAIPQPKENSSSSSRSSQAERSGGEGSSQASGANQQQKHTRVRTGCFQCKRRHVRCDESGRPTIGTQNGAGNCAACRRLGLPCTWPSPLQGKESLGSRPKRKKPKSNRSSCHNKDKDSGSEQIQDDTLIRLGYDELSRAMVDAFFEEVYPCSVFGFIQRDAFYESFQSKKVSRELLLSMCSLSIKYVISNHEKQSRIWTAEAKSLVHRHMERGWMTLSTLSSLIFCFHQELFNRIFGAAWMTSGIAIRLAFAMRLNMTPTKSPPGTRPMTWAEGESRRRMMWAVYVMDMYVCDGFPEFSNVPTTSIRIQLPCDDQTFMSNQGYESGLLDHGTEPPASMWPAPQLDPRSAASPFVQYILIFSIRTTILRYLRKKTMYQDLPWQKNSTVAKCEEALHSWRENLPPELEIDNEQQLASWSSAQVSTILSINLWYCMSYCDLGRLTIFAFVECASPEILLSAPQAYLTEAQNRCVEHASRMLDLCNHVLEQLPGFISRDPYVASCLYQAVRIILWDIFRHPSPSIVMKKFTADSCRPAIIMLSRLAGDFSYAGSVMEDMFSLLRRYGMEEVMSTRLPSDIANCLKNRDRLYKPGPAIFVDASEQSALRSSPEPVPGNSAAFSADRGESELFRPPFHSKKDVRIELESSSSSKFASDGEPSPSDASWHPPTNGQWQGTLANDVQGEQEIHVSPVYRGMAVGGSCHNELAAEVAYQPSQIHGNNLIPQAMLPGAMSSITPGIFDADPITDRESQFLGDMSHMQSFDVLGQSWPPMYSHGNGV